MSDFILARENETKKGKYMNYLIIKYIKILHEQNYTNYTFPMYKEENSNKNLNICIKNITKEDKRKICDYVLSIERDPVYEIIIK
jgi:hypothetical protein